MLLLSDFDGVWTHPGREGLAQGQVVDAWLAEWAAADGVTGVGEWLAARRAAFVAEPRAHGWDSHGRLSAYADEDPFILHSALLRDAVLAAPEDAHARWLVDAIARHGFDSVDAFGSATHDEAVRRVERERGPALLADAAAAGRRMIDAGIAIVVVSNSPAEKLERWFAPAWLVDRVARHAPEVERIAGLGAVAEALSAPPPSPS